MATERRSTPSRRTVLTAALGAVVTGGVAVAVGAATSSDKAYMSLQSAINAAKPGDTVEISRGWLIGAPVTVNKALTIRCVRGGSVATTKDVHAFSVTASNVQFDQVAIKGVEGKTGGTQAAIRAVGTVNVPIKGLKIQRCTIAGFAKYGVEAHHVHGPVIESNTIEKVTYGGIMVLSGKGGRITRNTIRNITQRTFKNSYGIALSRMHTMSIAEAPQTTGVLVDGNTIDGVPEWEGIDTHAGRDIRILNNTVRNCKIGIAVVPGSNTKGIAYAAANIRVIGNTIDSKIKDGSRRQGIQIVGARNGAGKVIAYATAEVSRNTVTGHGTQSTSIQSGIHIEATSATIVRDNRLIECSPHGVHAYNNNYRLVIKGNTFTDTWSNALDFSAAVYVSSANQTVEVSGNTTRRSAKKAKKVNDHGLFVPASAKRPNVAVTSARNNFNACAKPLVDASRTQKLT